jgi:hypothetical protein
MMQGLVVAWLFATTFFVDLSSIVRDWLLRFVTVLLQTVACETGQRPVTTVFRWQRYCAATVICADGGMRGDHESGVLHTD